MDEKHTILNYFDFSKYKLTDREKWLPGAVLLILGISYFTFMRPTIETVSRLKRNLEETQTELAALEEKRTVLTALESGSQARTFDAQFLRAERYLPSNKPSLETLLTLTRLARVEQVSLSAISLTPGTIKNTPDEAEQAVLRENNPEKENNGEKDGKIEGFDISFSIKGRKQNTLSFISELSKIAPMMRVEQLSLSVPSQTKSQDLFLDSNLNVRIFFQELPDKLPPIVEPLESLTKAEEEFLEQLQGYRYLEEEFTNPDQIQYTETLGKTNPFQE